MISRASLAKFPITRFVKENNYWKGKVVDFKRNSLVGRIFYHSECKNLFTFKTLKKLYGTSKTDDQELIKEFSDYPCPGCNNLKTLVLMRIYPLIVEEDSEEKFMQHTKLTSFY